MESSTHKNQTEEQKQAEIRRQITLLQAQLKDPSGTSGASISTTPRKRKSDGQAVLAPATPSPKKKKKVVSGKTNHSTAGPSRSNASTLRANAPKHAKSAFSRQGSNLPMQAKPTASTVLTKLASLSSAPVHTPHITPNRTYGFEERAVLDIPREEDQSLEARRGEDLALIEDLRPGPYDHTAPFDDPHFEKLEPNSGIRLSSRMIPYDDFQEYLRGRYYLSSSKLYSVVRLQPSKAAYDVPVEGDWVTIAVVAERGPVKYSRAPVGVGKDEKLNLSDEEDDLKDLKLDESSKPSAPQQNGNGWKGKGEGKGKASEAPQKPSGKKYMNLKLVDFGCRTRSSASGGQAVIRGDAFLTLLLFEADRVDVIERDDGVKQKLYKGGSQGAFEKLSKLKEGSVVAFLNPRILKPFQRAGNAPHPTDNVLAITPESAEAIAIVGQSRDLGMCTVLKRDGKICGSWCDKRVSDVCDYHLQTAVQRKRAGRAEFSVGTSGMTSAATKRKAEYDPARQWGLKPEPETGGGSTYILSGHIINDGPSSSSLFVSEKIGRDAQAKAARQISAKETDRALEQLLKRDKEGTRTLKAAREFAKEAEKIARGAKAEKNEKRGKDRQTDSDSDPERETNRPVRNAYSASLVKALGFDPTARNGNHVKDSDVEKKLKMLATVHASRKDVELGPRPGKLKSNVRIPSELQSPAFSRVSIADQGSGPNVLVSVPESNREPEDTWGLAHRIGQTDSGKNLAPSLSIADANGLGMVDLDSSDVEP